MKDRRSFLKEVCPTVAFAFFGISFLEACSSDTTDDLTPNPGGGGNTGGGTSQDNGFTFSNNTYTIDLAHSNFSQLSQEGGWMNAQSLGIPLLFLRVSNNDINAYTNKCPHQGVQTAWTYQSDLNQFKCQASEGGHDNTYSDDGKTPGEGGVLVDYVTSLSEDGKTLTVNL
ncbi:MAG: Rieske 2Fe-2S domain-containing protein [Flavobacteriaceae bacterium]|nr:Rieske 2Fe-2S domain-containing protein [Flavobacteriaceae bacterium]